MTRHPIELIQSISKAQVLGTCLWFPDGTLAWIGPEPGLAFTAYSVDCPNQWRDQPFYDAIKARLSKAQPAQEWREKIIQLIETAELLGPTNDLNNGRVRFSRSLSEDYVNMWRMDIEASVTLHSPEFIGAVDARRAELLRAKRRAKDDAQLEAIERILS